MLNHSSDDRVSKALDCDDMEAVHPVLGFQAGFIVQAWNTESGVVYQEFQIRLRCNTILNSSEIRINRQIRRQDLGILDFLSQFFQAISSARN